MESVRNILAWWLNVGVQMFLCISGFLFGQAKQEELTEFYGRRFRKILTPYYVVFITAGLLEVIFARDSFHAMKFLAGLFCRTTIKGGEHLWFIALILMCYILTPALKAYRDKYVNNLKSFCIYTSLCVLSLSFFFAVFNPYYSPAWISCYVIGFALGINQKYNYASHQKILSLFAVLAFAGNGVQIYAQFLILGPFSMMAVTPVLPVNLALAAAGIVIMALALKKVEKVIDLIL